MDSPELQLTAIKDVRNVALLTQDYLRWFNDQRIRLHLFPTTPRTEAEIAQWLTLILRDPSRWYASILLGGINLGHVGLTLDKNSPRNAELSIIIGEPSYWGMGIGAHAVHKHIEYASTHFAVRRETARIKPENTASVKLFQKIGFVNQGLPPDELGFTLYVRNEA